MNRRPRRSSGSGLLVLLLLAGTTVGLLGWFPAIPCPRCRGSVYRERLRVASLPNVTAPQAAAILAYAESDQCGRCRGGRQTLFLSWMWHGVCGG